MTIVLKKGYNVCSVHRGNCVCVQNSKEPKENATEGVLEKIPQLINNY